MIFNNEVTIGQGPGLEGGPQVNRLNIPLPFKQTTCTANKYYAYPTGMCSFSSICDNFHLNAKKLGV